MPERGEIWPTAADSTQRPGRARSRDVLVIQCRELLQEGHPFTLVIPLTSDLVEDAEPLRIRIPACGRLRYSADLMMDQMFALDTDKLVQGPLARLDDRVMARVDDAVREILGLSD